MDPAEERTRRVQEEFAVLIARTRLAPPTTDEVPTRPYHKGVCPTHVDSA